MTARGRPSHETPTERHAMDAQACLMDARTMLRLALQYVEAGIEDAAKVNARDAAEKAIEDTAA